MKKYTIIKAEGNIIALEEVGQFRLKDSSTFRNFWQDYSGYLSFGLVRPRRGVEDLFFCWYHQLMVIRLFLVIMVMMMLMVLMVSRVMMV